VAQRLARRGEGRLSRHGKIRRAMMLRWMPLAPSLQRKAQSVSVQSGIKAPSSQVLRIAGRDVLDGVGGVVYTG